MHILFIAPRYPYPPHRGDQVRAFHLLRCLSSSAEVTLVCFDSGPEIPIEGLRVRAVAPTLAGRLVANLARPSPTLPLQVRLFLDRGMHRVVVEEVSSPELEVVHLTLARMAPYLPPARPGLHRHLDLVDTLSLNMRERARQEHPALRPAFRGEAALMRRYESRIIAAADSASVVSEADRAATGDGSVAVVPNGVDPTVFPYAEPTEGPPVLIFFGNLGYFHNVEPARFVARQVLPAVAKRVPGVRLRIVGARPAPSVRALAELEGVEVLADVPEMAAELHRSSVAVLPLFSGSGIKNKLLEAFSAGLPVVANAAGTLGIEGLVPGRHCLVGESAEEIAVAAADLLCSAEERRCLARAANELVLERYSWEHQAERLRGLYADSA